MMLRQGAILMVVLCSAIEGFAQVSLKKSTIAAERRIAWIGISVVLFLIEAALYTCALQWLDISVAYPLGALCFVMVAFLSRWLLHEIIIPTRWIGIGLIAGGCILITR